MSLNEFNTHVSYLKYLCIIGYVLLVGNMYGQESHVPQSGFRNEHPEDHLPPYIQKVSGFGERPDWSHDGERILFVEKPMGEVYELELKTGIISPKTRHFNHFGFTRAMYMPNGDILLSGPRASFDPTDKDSRNTTRDLSWLSVMDKTCTKAPVPLDVLCAEGPALSRTQMKVAWTLRDRQIPQIGKNHAQIWMAEIKSSDGGPTLENKRMIFDSHQLPFPLGNSSLETQNFVPPHDSLLLFTVYQIDNGNNTDTYIINTNTGTFHNLTRSPGYYDEPEGVFPDGQFTCVEHGPSDKTAWPMIDIFKLNLDGSGEMQRLTHFSDFNGYKASQGVVSDDGNYLCFQIGKKGDEAGVGYGFFVMDLKAAGDDLEPVKSYAEGLHPMQQIANKYLQAWTTDKPLPALSKLNPDITLDEAYDIQRAWVIQSKGYSGIGGVKGGVVTPSSLELFGIDKPLGGILRASGTIDGAEEVTLRLSEYVDMVLETEIGFVVGKTIDQELQTVEEFKEYVNGIIPVMEIASGAWDQPEGDPIAIDFAAINLKAHSIIKGKPVDPSTIDPKAVKIVFSKDDEALHEAVGSDCWEGPWETGLFMAQFAHRQGIKLEPGQIIICGALGSVHPGAVGKYLMDTGDLGKVQFTIIE